MKKIILLITVIAAATLFVLNKPAPQNTTIVNDTAIIGQEPWVILDIDVFKKISEIADQSMSYGFPDHQIDWKHLLNRIEAGEIDATGGAVQTAAREKWALFTAPYRIKEDVVYMKPNADLSFQDVESFLDYAKEKKLKVGVIGSFVFASKMLNEVVRDPENSNIFIDAPSDVENMNALKAGKLDAIITNRLRGTKMLELAEYKNEFQEYRINAIVPVHFLLSKKTISSEQLESLNKAIKQIKDSGWLLEQTSKVPGA